MRFPPFLSWQLAILALPAFALTASCSGGEETEVDASLIRSVERSDLRITVRERGEIQAASDTKVSSELEGRATLIQLIPEGSVVAAGDKLAELDVSAIVERRAVQAISVAKVEAVLEQSRKAVEILEKELLAAERTAATRLEIARLQFQRFIGQPSLGDGATNATVIAALQALIDQDPEAFGEAGSQLIPRIQSALGSEENLQLEMGDLAMQILQQIDAIGLTRSNLKLAERTLFFSRKLHAEGFLTENELAQDEIDYQRLLSAQTIAWNSLLLLVNYTATETLLTLRLEEENAQLNLESVRGASAARRVREIAELRSVEAEHLLANQQLENLDAQIERGILYAPSPGLVVYGRWDWDEPVFEGMEIRERQEVVILPDIANMMAQIKVPESQIGKLAVGQKATLMVEAFPNRPFLGEVTYVASLPEPAPRSQVVKLYMVHVRIDGDNPLGELRPGMSCTVTIEVGTVADVINVPIAALQRLRESHFVWRETSGGPEAVPVALGANNLTHIEVVSGLRAGERIYLVRPPGVQLPDASATEAAAETAVSIESSAEATQ